MLFDREITAKSSLVTIYEGFFTSTAKKSYIALTDQGFVSITNFLTGIFLARLCTKEEYGLYVLAFSLLILWDGFRSSLISSPLTIYLPRKGDAEQPSYVGSATLMQAFLVLAGAIVFGAGAVIVKATGDASLAAVILAGIFASCGYSSREHVRRVFYAQLRVRRTLLVDGSYCLVQLGLLAMLWVNGQLSSVNALLAMGVAQTLAAAFGLMLIGKGISFKDLGLRSALSSHWKLGKWLAATVLVFALGYQIYPWLLKYTWGMEAVATLGACQYLLYLSNPFIIGIQNILLPKMAHAFSAEGVLGLKRVTRKGQLALVVAVGSFLVIVSLLAEPLLELFYKGKYAGSGFLVVVLAVDILLKALATPLISALVTMEHPDAIFYSYLGAMTVTLLAGYPLAKAWGPIGAAVGYICGDIVTVSIRYFFYRREILRLAEAAP